MGLLARLAADARHRAEPRRRHDQPAAPRRGRWIGAWRRPDRPARPRRAGARRHPPRRRLRRPAQPRGARAAAARPDGAGRAGPRGDPRRHRRGASRHPSAHRHRLGCRPRGRLHPAGAAGRGRARSAPRHRAAAQYRRADRAATSTATAGWASRATPRATAGSPAMAGSPCCRAFRSAATACATCRTCCGATCPARPCPRQRRTAISSACPPPGTGWSPSRCRTAPPAFWSGRRRRRCSTAPRTATACGAATRRGCGRSCWTASSDPPAGPASSCSATPISTRPTAMDGARRWRRCSPTRGCRTPGQPALAAPPPPIPDQSGDPAPRHRRLGPARRQPARRLCPAVRRLDGRRRRAWSGPRRTTPQPPASPRPARTGSSGSTSARAARLAHLA